MHPKKNSLENKTVVISRTDSIGDVILTLPLCAWIKENYPSAKIVFLGKKYTRPILECFDAIDEILFWDEIQDQTDRDITRMFKSKNADVFIHVFPIKRIAKLAKKAGINERIGTSHRTYHLLTCNIRPSFTRKNSDKHEAQLNFELLSSYGVTELPELDQIGAWASSFKARAKLSAYTIELLNTQRKKIILHPKSQGSAVEWPIENYIELANELVEKDYRVYFSGTENEGKKFRELLPDNADIIDISGKMNLSEFISFIDETGGLVACSTGPLHIAAILGKVAVGLYTKVRPMHPGRWMPIGKMTELITSEKDLSSAEEEIKSIQVKSVLKKIAL